MSFKNCKLDNNELREYHPGFPYIGKVFIPHGGTIDRENNIRLFKYGNGPVDEQSDLFQFVFDYKGIPLFVQLKQALKGNDVYWRECFIELIEEFQYDYDDVKKTLQDAMKVYAYKGYNLPSLMEVNKNVTVHIEF